MSHASEHRRAENFKAVTIKLRRRIFALEREVKSARTSGFINGSAETMAAVYAALPDDGVCLLVSQWMMASRRRKPPFGLNIETEKRVRELAADLCRRAGIKTIGVRSMPL